MKRTIGILGGIAFFLLANTVRAEPMEVDGGLYLGVRAGVTFLEQDEETFNWPAWAGWEAQTEVRTLNMNMGFIGTAALGYTMAFPKGAGDIRFELEAGHRYYIDGETNADWDLFGHRASDIDGIVTISSAMFNIYADLHTPTRFVPYVGVGVGYSRIDIDAWLYDWGRTVYGHPWPIKVKERLYNVSWQAMVGVGYKVTPGTVVGLEYRSFRLSDGTYSELFRYETLSEMEIDTWLLTFRYTF